MSDTTTPRLLRPKEAAEMLAISERTLWGLTASGQIGSIRVGKRSVRYDVADVQAFITRQRTGGDVR